MSIHELSESSQQEEDLAVKIAEFPDSALFVYDQFLLFGDSITQSDGDPSLGFSSYQSLQHGKSPLQYVKRQANLVDYCRRIDVVKRGFSGYNTVNALSILPRILPSPRQSHVCLIVRVLRTVGWIELLC